MTPLGLVPSSLRSLGWLPSRPRATRPCGVKLWTPLVCLRCNRCRTCRRMRAPCRRARRWRPPSCRSLLCPLRTRPLLKCPPRILPRASLMMVLPRVYLPRGRCRIARCCARGRAWLVTRPWLKWRGWLVAYVKAEAERAEEAGKRGDATTLYEITRKLSGRFQNTCKPVRNEAGVLLRTAEEEMHRWREQFQTVLNHEEPSNPPEVEPNDELNIRTGHVTRIEIKNAIEKLKNGKAAGCDNIPPEATKAGGDTSEEVLLGLCNRIWSEEKIPEEWRKGLLIKLPKKGNLSYCKNWRVIMFLNMASIFFCRVILERIKIALDEKLREEQAGFRAGRSFTERIATLRIIIEQSIEWQSSLYINFVDFEKAFDSISRDVLWRLLRHYGLPDKIVTIIRVLYEGFSAQVVHNGQKTQPLDMRTGVRQGCLLSPLLFLVALDWVTRTAFDRKRYSVDLYDISRRS